MNNLEVSIAAAYKILDEKIIRFKAKNRGHRIWKFKTDNPKTRVVIKNGKPQEVPITLDQKRKKDKGIRKAKKKSAQGRSHSVLLKRLKRGYSE